jgi:hypothetical protein
MTKKLFFNSLIGAGFKPAPTGFFTPEDCGSRGETGLEIVLFAVNYGKK